MNLIIIEERELKENNLLELSDSRADHIRNVLGASRGQTVNLGILNGPLGTGRVRKINPSRVILKCKFSEIAPKIPPVDLIMAMPRPKVLKRLWPQISALGVGRIVIVNAAKVERYYFDSHVLKEKCRRRLLIKGLQQVCDTRPAEVAIRKQLKPFLEDELDSLFPTKLRLLAKPDARQSLRELPCLKGTAERIVLAIGPEGGWTPYEVELFRRKKFQVIRTGNRTLSTETACVALLGIINEFANSD